MRYFQQYGILLLLVVLFIAAYFSGISIQSLLDGLSNLSWLQALILIGVFLAISMLSIVGKKLLLFFLGYKISFQKITLIHFASISAHYSTPAKIGYPVSIYLLKKLGDIPVVISTASIVIELFVTVLIPTIVAIIGSAVYFGNQIINFSQGILYLLSGLIVVSLVVVILLKKSKKVKALLIELQKAVVLITFRKAALYLIVQIFVQILSAFLLMLTTSFVYGNIGFFPALVARSAAFVIGAFSMIPMGLGTRDLSLVFYLKGFGIQSEIAIIIAAIERVIASGAGYLIGLIASGIIGVNSIRSIKNETV